MAGNVSGGHFNPAVTVTMAFLGRLPWRKVIPYCLAQIFGAFLGAAVVFILYYGECRQVPKGVRSQILHFSDAINAFDGGVRQIDGPNGTAGIFATYPLPELSVGGSIFDQVSNSSCIASLFWHLAFFSLLALPDSSSRSSLQQIQTTAYHRRWCHSLLPSTLQ